MKTISRLITLLPCANLEQFPDQLESEEADSLLANWTAAWHPLLIANANAAPVWSSTNQTAVPKPMRLDEGNHGPLDEEDDSRDDTYGDSSEDDFAFDDAYGDHHTGFDDHDPGRPFSGAKVSVTGSDAADAGHGQRDSAAGESAGNEPAAASMWANSVIFIPTVSNPQLSPGFAAYAVEQGAVLIAGLSQRKAIISHAVQRLKAAGFCLDPSRSKTDSSDEERTSKLETYWAPEFFALSYAWLQVQLMTRKIRFSCGLDQPMFEARLVDAAIAVAQGDDTAAETHIVRCYDLLLEEKNNYYPVKPDLVDLVLTTPSLLGKKFQQELQCSHASNFFLTGESVETLAAKNPEALATISQRIEAETLTVLGGNQQELPDSLVCKESILNQMLQNASTFANAEIPDPEIHLRYRSGLNVHTPELIGSLGYNGCLHVSFDGGKVADSSSGTIRWDGHAGVWVLTKTEIPLSANLPETFLGLGVTIGRQIDSAHTATMLLTHWPGQRHPAMEDLRRIANRVPLLGDFCTLDDVFSRLYDPGYEESFQSEEYDAKCFQKAIDANSVAPISAVAGYWHRQFLLGSAQQLLTWLSVQAAVRGGDRAISGKIGDLLTKVGCSVRFNDQSIAAWPQKWAEASADTSPQQVLDEVVTAAKSFLEDLAGNSDSSRLAIINPLGFRRRISWVDRGTTPTDVRSGKMSATCLRKTQQPFGLHYQSALDSIEHRIVDAESASLLVSVESAESRCDPDREPPVLVGMKLRNEFFEATVDEKTGGLQSIFFHAKRGNRAGQRLVFRSAGSKEVRSQMVCDHVTTDTISPLAAEVTTQGRILHDEKTIANFQQKFRLSRGIRILELQIRIDPLIELPGSIRDHFASETAWQDESCSLRISRQHTAQPWHATRLEAPNFVEIQATDYRLTLLTGGLPFHQRTSRCRISTMLIAGREQRRDFRIGIGIDVRYPVRAAIDFGSPVLALPMPTGKPGNAPLLPAFHVDSRNVVVTWSQPSFDEAGSLVGLVMRIQETEGRSGRFRLRCLLPIDRVDRADFNGEVTSNVFERSTESSDDEGAEGVKRDDASPPEIAFNRFEYFQIHVTLAPSQ